MASKLQQQHKELYKDVKIMHQMLVTTFEDLTKITQQARKLSHVFAEYGKIDELLLETRKTLADYPKLTTKHLEHLKQKIQEEPLTLQKAKRRFNS